jgi:hypothetical protein
LVQTHADAKFRLKEGTTPVNMAMVKVDADSMLTNSLGIALFNDLPVSVEYAYTITRDGYIWTEGSFYLTRDTTNDVAMDRRTSVNEPVYNGLRTTCWLNPPMMYPYSGGRGLVG